jgi:hypothetical protein
MDNFDSGSKWKPTLLVNEGFDYGGGTYTPVGGMKNMLPHIDSLISKLQSNRISMFIGFSVQSLNVVGGTLITRTMS